MELYGQLARWWPVLRPPEAFEDIASLCFSLLGNPQTLLELGSGSGQLASHLQAEMTLVDLSSEMLAISQALCPQHRHVQADIRTLNLDRRFEAVLLHDAVMYLTSPEDLLATFRAAHRHLLPGGRFLIVPDVVRETWAEGTIHGGTPPGATPSAQLLEWHWDPDPTDQLTRVEFSLLVRENGVVQSIHESHELAVYDRGTFWRLLREAGFTPEEADPYLSTALGEVFLARAGAE